jgi:superfamily II DNA or RNA helicase
MLPPWTAALRDWQQRAFYTYVTLNKRNFLMVATPGAGKTIAAARIAHSILSANKADRLVVVCPSEHLKKQWAGALAPFGIQLHPRFKNADGAVSADYHGIIATYHQIASNPDIHRAHCRRPTLLIADEIHHAGDERSWGGALQEAFEPAVARILLSGTPFRSDGVAIPFVEYGDDGSGVMRSKADFSYGYGDALREMVCRPVLFPSYEGDMEWQSGFDTYRATFRDELPEDEARRRLRTALDPEGEWIRTVLRDANQRLTEIRANGHPRAGGLVLCSDAGHARRVAETLRRVTSEAATIALSEDDDASDRIKAYADGNTRWIVAVRMVSEGVDIPRLRVGVYATHWIAELFFRQVVGRFVRMILDANRNPTPEEQSAFLFIPRDENLIGYAQRIKEERDHELDRELDDLRKEPRLDETLKQSTLYAPISAEAQPDDVIFDHQSLNQREIDEARSIATQCGVNLPAEIIARMFRFKGTPLGSDTNAAPGPTAASEPDPLHVRKDKVRKVMKRVVAQLVQASNNALDYATIYTELMRRDGIDQKHATLQQLEARLEFVTTWLERYRNGQAA